MARSKIKPGERSFGGQVIAWIKEQISHGGSPFGNAWNDASLYGLPTTKFPDVLLTLDAEGRQPFCGWELKTPSTDARDPQLLEKAVEKARALKAHYFVTWNMATAIIWRTRPRGMVCEEDKVREYPPIPQIRKEEDIQKQVVYMRLKEQCARLLIDLGRLYEDASVNLAHADTSVFVGVLRQAAQELYDPMLEALSRRRGNRKFDKELDAWAKKQGVNKYDTDYQKTLARQIVYKLIAKILFYQTLRRYRLRLPPMTLAGIPTRQLGRKLGELFQKARDIDYQAVFEPDITDTIPFARRGAEILADMVEHLNEYNFEQMPLDVVGRVFEQLIPPETRHSLGQYFTREDLVDFIVAFCVRHPEDRVLDPTCGTGTFLVRAYDRLKRMAAKPHHKLLPQLWGVDIARFPAQLATINLFRQDLSDYNNFPRVVSDDFFKVKPGAEFEFPPPRVALDPDHKEKETIPLFDGIVGNFPYIRQELIERSSPGYKKDLERALFEDWHSEYRELFRDHRLCLSGQADIYAYLFFHAAAHLKVGGRMGIVVSNAWLDVAYGHELQKFFLRKFKIIAVVESRCEAWFDDVAINTVFVVLERCEEADERDEHLAKFVKLKKPLAELFPQDLANDAARRWSHVQEVVDRIEGIGLADSPAARAGAHKSFGPVDTEHVKLAKIDSYDDDRIRVRSIRQADLREQVETAGRTVKWGPYLRAPDVYFKILETCADKLVPLGKVAEVRFGIKTGINDFFYLTQEQAKHWGIEKRFLKPVIKSPRDTKTITVDPKALKLFVFLCDKPVSELAGTKALKYIRWGANQLAKSTRQKPGGRRLKNVPSVKGRTRWYSIPAHRLPKIIWTKAYNDTFIQRHCPQGVFADQRVYEVLEKPGVPVDILAALTNSTFTAFLIENTGRTTLGEGALELTVEETENDILIPDPRLFASEPDRKVLIGAFRKIAKRAVLPIHREIRQRSRQNLDNIVWRKLGITEEKVQELTREFPLIIKERLTLPRLRSTSRKTREVQNLSELARFVEEAVLPSGIRRFPEGFVRGKVDWEDVGVPKEPLHVGARGIAVCELVLSDGTHFAETSLEHAKAICYAQRNHSGSLVVKVPTDEFVLVKALKDYTRYVRKIRERLYAEFMAKSGDAHLSETLTGRVLSNYGLDLTD